MFIFYSILILWKKQGWCTGQLPSIFGIAIVLLCCLLPVLHTMLSMLPRWSKSSHRIIPSQSAFILIDIQNLLHLPNLHPCSKILYREKPATPPGCCCLCCLLPVLPNACAPRCLCCLLPVLPCCRGGVNSAPLPAPVNQLYLIY